MSQRGIGASLSQQQQGTAICIFQRMMLGARGQAVTSQTTCQGQAIIIGLPTPLPYLMQFQAQGIDKTPGRPLAQHLMTCTVEKGALDRAVMSHQHGAFGSLLQCQQCLFQRAGLGQIPIVHPRGKWLSGRR